MGQSGRAGCNMDVLLRHDGAGIDNGCLSLWGIQERREGQGKRGHNYWLKRLQD